MPGHLMEWMDGWMVDWTDEEWMTEEWVDLNKMCELLINVNLITQSSHIDVLGSIGKVFYIWWFCLCVCPLFFENVKGNLEKNDNEDSDRDFLSSQFNNSKCSEFRYIMVISISVLMTINVHRKYVRDQTQSSCIMFK